MKRITWPQVRGWIEVNIRITDAGCWEWLRPLSEAGYGRLYGRQAHALSYECHVGPIPRGLDIDHLCRNRACVNPDHLEAVTRRENLARGIGVQLQKERAEARVECSVGHPLTPVNTYVRPSDGARLCRSCRAEQDRLQRAKDRDKRNARKRAKRAGLDAKDYTPEIRT